MHHPRDRLVHTPVFGKLVHWLERKVAQWELNEGSIRQSIAPRAIALTTEPHLAP